MKLLIENNQPSRFTTDSASGFTVTVIPGLELGDYTPAILANLIDREYGPKEAAKFRVKLRAAELIDALQWRIERAKEREDIGAGGETVGDVLREREAIRRASNRAEAYIDAMGDETEARQYQFSVLPSDYPENSIITRLQFMRRMTDEERKAIRAARDSGQSQDLLDFWELLQLATSINLNDADIQSGVQMLEQSGLISAGRATEVLTI